MAGSQSDKSSWLDSFLAHKSLLSRVIARFAKPHEIEDIVQETFVRSYAASRKKRIRNPQAFMLTTATNLALNASQRHENQLARSMEDLVHTDFLSHTQTPESECEAQEQFLVFCRAVAELPVHCRRVFILKKVYGISQKEIAAYLNLSESTVEKHVAKGMLMTARYMLDNGYDIEIGPNARNTHHRIDKVQDA